MMEAACRHINVAASLADPERGQDVRLGMVQTCSKSFSLLHSFASFLSAGRQNLKLVLKEDATWTHA